MPTRQPAPAKPAQHTSNLCTNLFNVLADHPLAFRTLLADDPRTARQLADQTDISQATISRAIQSLGDQSIRFGPYQSIHYALRRPLLATPEIPIWRITSKGRADCAAGEAV